MSDPETEMEMEAPTRVDKFNQTIRGVILLMLAGAFVYAFVVLKDVVSVAEFVIVLTIAMNWWFTKPEDKKAPAKNGNGNGNGATPQVKSQELVAP